MKRYVVCVDDDRQVLEALRKDLRAETERGYHLEFCESAAEADELLAEIEKEGHQLAVIVCDQVMPGEGGVQFLERINARHPEAKKVLLTGYAGIENAVYGINHARLDRYLEKPWNGQALQGTVHELLNAFDIVLDRLVQNEIANLQAAELRRDIPSFEEIVHFYGETRFLYPAKLEELSSRFDTIRATWAQLIQGSNHIFKLLLRKVADGGRIVAKNSVCAFEYLPGTWQGQHLVSSERREYSGTLAVLLCLLEWFSSNVAVEYVRLSYRPDNPGTNLLFGSAGQALSPGEVCAITCDYFVSGIPALNRPTGSDPAVRVTAVDSDSAAAVREFYSTRWHPALAASMTLDDPALDRLNEKFAQFGLQRKRQIFVVRMSQRIVGAIVCNFASEGMNFSFLENAIEGLEIASDIAPNMRRYIFSALLDQAVRYYRSQGRNCLVWLLNPELRDLRQEFGIDGPKVKQYVVQTFAGGETTDRWARAVRRYYRDHLLTLAQNGEGGAR